MKTSDRARAPDTIPAKTRHRARWDEVRLARPLRRGIFPVRKDVTATHRRLPFLSFASLPMTRAFPRASALLAALSILLAGACGDGGTGPGGPGAPSITLSVSPSPVEAGQPVTVTARVDPRGSGAAFVWLRIPVMAISDSIALSGTGAQTIERTYPTPAEMAARTMEVTATAGGGKREASASFSLVVTARPVPQVVALSTPSGVVPGDSFTVSFTVRSGDGIAMVTARTQFLAAWASDSLRYGGEKEVSGTIRLPSTPGASQSILWLDVRDVVGRSVTAQETLTFDRLPTVYGGLDLPSHRNPILLPGDTFWIRVGAGLAPGHTLRWAGYAIGEPVKWRDSVAVSGRETMVRFPVVAREEWAGETIPVEIFVHDERGRPGTAPVPMLARVMRGVRPRQRVAALPGVAFDYAIDERRNVAYVSIPESNQVAVVSLATMTAQAQISVTSPLGLDLTPSGDSLVVASRAGGSLVVVNLASGGRSELPIPGLTTSWGSAGWPRRVRVAANGKALVATTFAGSGTAARLVEVELRTGAQRFRQEVGIDGFISDDAALTRSGNHRKIMMTEMGGMPMNAQVYDSDSGRLTPTRAVLDFGDFGQYAAPITGDAAGDHFLLGVSLWRSDLGAVRYLRGTEFTYYVTRSDASALAPDGATAYVQGLPGVWKMRTSDSAVLERFWLDYGDNFREMRVHPSGRLLFALSDDGLHAIDLP